MKKVIGLSMACLMLFSNTPTMADAGQYIEVTNTSLVNVINEEAIKDDERLAVEVTGNEFTITLDDNKSTGYKWDFVNLDKELNEFIEKIDLESESDLLGAPSKTQFKFKSLKEGLNVITFTYSREFEKTFSDTISVLVYRTGDKLSVEEDKMVFIQNSPTPGSNIEVENTNGNTEDQVLALEDMKLTYNGEEISLEAGLEKQNFISMLPLRQVAESMGYKVTWNQEEQKIELSKGAKWTSVKIDENSYFKNRMAAKELSSAPLLINNTTYVPVEFFVDILDVSLSISENTINFKDADIISHRGYVKEVKVNKDGSLAIFISKVLDSENPSDYIIVNTSPNSTIINTDLTEGNLINVIASPMMTRSLPPQTPGFLIY